MSLPKCLLCGFKSIDRKLFIAHMERHSLQITEEDDRTKLGYLIEFLSRVCAAGEKTNQDKKDIYDEIWECLYRVDEREGETDFKGAIEILMKERSKKGTLDENRRQTP